MVNEKKIKMVNRFNARISRVNLFIGSERESMGSIGS